MRDKKEIGAYYTPPELAKVMSNWAIREGTEHILEPSFGGCCFLDSTWQRLKELGVGKPFNHLYGADIDPRAFDYLKDRFGVRKYEKRFIQGDFLQLDTSDFIKTKFEIIIGNPPFIAHAALSESLKNTYRKSLNKLGFNIKGKPSVWAYFVLISLKYLLPGGRIAWVLPWSFLQSNYGKEIQTYITNSFSHVKVYAIEEELFLSEGTKERTIVLLAERYRENEECHKMQIRYCGSISDFQRDLTKVATHQRANTRSHKEQECERETATTLLSEFKRNKSCVDLSDLMRLSIGVVTGDMDTFSCTLKTANELNLGKKLYQICLVRSQNARGLTFTKNDVQELESEGKANCLITIPVDAEVPDTLANHLRTKISDDEINGNSTFSRREKWYVVPRLAPPDAFVRFFAQNGPRFIINDARAQATNSLFVAYFNEEAKNSGKESLLASISLSMISSLGGAYTELFAARYGTGAIKLSLTSTKAMPVYICPRRKTKYTLRCLAEADKFIREGKDAEACAVANVWLKNVSRNDALVSKLVDVTSKLTAMRLRNKKQNR